MEKLLKLNRHYSNAHFSAGSEVFEFLYGELKISYMVDGLNSADFLDVKITKPEYFMNGDYRRLGGTDQIHPLCCQAIHAVWEEIKEEREVARRAKMLGK